MGFGIVIVARHFSPFGWSVNITAWSCCSNISNLPTLLCVESIEQRSAIDSHSRGFISVVLSGVHLESVRVCPEFANEHNALVYAPQLDVLVIAPAQGIVNHGGRCQHPRCFSCEPLLERDHFFLQIAIGLPLASGRRLKCGNVKRLFFELCQPGWLNQLLAVVFGQVF